MLRGSHRDVFSMGCQPGRQLGRSSPGTGASPGRGFRCPAVVVQSGHTPGAACCVVGTCGVGRYQERPSPEYSVRGTCRWSFRSAPTAHLLLGGGQQALFVVAEFAVWLGMLLCACRRGGVIGAGLVVIAGLLPAVALAASRRPSRTADRPRSCWPGGTWRRGGRLLSRCGRGEGSRGIVMLRAIPRTVAAVAHTPGPCTGSTGNPC
jgi:hypothetical protein